MMETEALRSILQVFIMLIF